MVTSFFNSATRRVAVITGKPVTIASAFALIIAWALTGPFLDFSDPWQLTINTATTVITFLMVFIIQNSQNRESLAIQLKLDELLRTQKGAKNILFDLEELSQEELEALVRQYEALAELARKRRLDGGEVLALDISTEGSDALSSVLKAASVKSALGKRTRKRRNRQNAAGNSKPAMQGNARPEASRGKGRNERAGAKEGRKRGRARDRASARDEV